MTELTKRVTAISPPPKHVVAVSGLVTNLSNDRVLLICSPRRGWEFPGGQVEEGESLTQALVCEIQEETGVTVSIGPLVGVYSNTRSNIVMFGFLCTYESGEPQISSESLAVEWVSREEALLRVTRPPLHDRLRDMMDFSGSIVYRAYEFSAQNEPETGYHIREERFL